MATKTKSARFLRTGFSWTLVLAFSFLVIEGLASSALVVQQALRSQHVAERAHTRYDPDLGWVNLPKVRIDDLYGPGVGLQTNDQGFRNVRHIPAEVPAGKVRAICSGDSFTLGYGVSNEHTWCHFLETMNPRLETVNMGQGGYGVDQAYLWYRRDGVQVEHDLHLFAFITFDFERMKTDQFMGYGKPVLALESGRLVTRNTPTPQPSSVRAALQRRQPLLMRFDSIRLLSKVLHRMAGREPRFTVDENTGAVVTRIFAELKRLHAERGSTLVLVHLPTRGDYSTEISEPWRRFLAAEAARQNLTLIDLVDDFAASPAYALDEKFIPEGTLNFPGAAGHYTVRGNAWAAELLHRELLAIPELAGKLGSLPLDGEG